jgi:hypothetical protein
VVGGTGLRVAVKPVAGEAGWYLYAVYIPAGQGGAGVAHKSDGSWTNVLGPGTYFPSVNCALGSSHYVPTGVARALGARCT